MSILLEQAAKEAKDGNMDLKKSVRHIGNKFLNCLEMSEQECVYSLLELPITQSSIKVEFINTSKITRKQVGFMQSCFLCWFPCGYLNNTWCPYGHHMASMWKPCGVL